jgi:hypothetical protein
VFAYQGAVGPTTTSNYPVSIRNTFGTNGVQTKTRTSYVDDLTGTRTLLANAANGSVTIANIGGCVGLARLLNSPADAISTFTGQQLVAAKVALISVMGGNFTNGAYVEFNMSVDVASSQTVAAVTSVPMIWSGFEIGSTVFCRAPMLTDPTIDPVQYGFDVFGSEGTNNIQYIAGGRQSYDPIAIDLATRGIGDRYTLSAGGQVTVNANATVTFTAGAGASNQRYVSARLKTVDVLGQELTGIIGQTTKPVSPALKGMILPLTETTGRYYRDATYPGAMMMPAGQPKNASAAAEPTRVAAPNGTGQVLSFNGSQYIGHYDVLRFHSSSYVVGAIVNLTSITGVQTIASHKGPAPAMWELLVNAGKLQAISYGAAASGSPRTTPAPAADFPINTYVKVVAYHDGNTLSVFQNNVLVGQIAASGQYIGTGQEYMLSGYIQFGVSRTSGGAATLGMTGLIAGCGFWAEGTATTLQMMNDKLDAIAASKGIIF